MKSVELVRQAAVLQHLIKRVGHDPSTRALEMQGHWARYVCVLTAGYVENIVRDIYGQYVRKNSYSAPVIRYTTKQLEGVQNPRPDKLVKIAASFDPSWGRDLDAHLGQNFRSDAVNAIMSNRHLIAHGRNSNITVGQVNLYLGKVIEVAEFMEVQCGL
ncbi:MAG: HEPN domain-containing protein [Polaromonas sp.]|uniref:HEPN domain-containing protein n=1 Tax=Polaromonas sp. TaxID=1869339 RepID=UPI00271823B7|nr:HEPN domain-containing protein [Polaromonas sp.]MDO9113263.1 HEPN domain-containing protein [Polaromonas sp.]MDP1889104.1 HEPN domain-containing protein [Polaromonas sp.]